MSVRASIRNIEVSNEMGQTTKLENYLQGNALLTLGYFHCKHMCHAIIENIRRLHHGRPKNYHVVFLSIADFEGPTDALGYKKRLLAHEKKRWDFLTLANPSQLTSLTKAMNFQIRPWGPKMLEHQIGVYLFQNGEMQRRIETLPLTEEKIVFSPKGFTSRILRWCENFHAENGEYTPLALRFTMIVSVIFLTVFSLWLTFQKRRENKGGIS